MHEVTRLAYLQAMGVDSYVSRGQLPGAAASRRLALRPAPRPDPERPAEAPAREAPRRPEVDLVVDAPPARNTDAAPGPTPAARRGAPLHRFSVVAVQAGPYLWLEELGDTPLAREQVQLVRAMALAISGELPSPEVSQFDWPMHTNQQLDLSDEAAAAALAGFLARRVSRGLCRGAILLGAAVAARLDTVSLGVAAVSCPHSSAEMLQRPALKREAWRALAPLRDS